MTDFQRSFPTSPPDPEEISALLDQVFQNSSHRFVHNAEPSCNPDSEFSDAREFFDICEQKSVFSNISKRRKPNLGENPTTSSCFGEKRVEVLESPLEVSRPRNYSKRSRAAEVHNLSEKRRRCRINEKMKELQMLIPNSNKTDKASMLDEAIEYLKQLQLQVQMLTFRHGLAMHPLYSSTGLDPSINLPFPGSTAGDGTDEAVPLHATHRLLNQHPLLAQPLSLPSSAPCLDQQQQKDSYGITGCDHAFMSAFF